MRIATAAAVFSLSLFAAAATNAAVPSCAPQEAIVAGLANQYSEASLGYGVAPTNQMVEIFASEGGETWTVVVHNPNGQSCIVAHGQNWRGFAV